MTERPPRGFRPALLRELPSWIAEGILSEEQAARIHERYRLDDLAGEGRRLLASVIFTIGALLVGGGVIAFVAAHWERIPVAGKLALLFAVLLGFHAAGYWLWRVKGWTRLGHALVFCGTLVFGANIGLIAQIFHIRSEWYGGFGPWALGAIAMAWAAGSAVTGVFAVGVSVPWIAGFAHDHPELGLLHPLALAILVLPLAHLLRSRALHGFTLVGIFLGMGIAAGTEAEAGSAVLLAFAAGGFGAWAVSQWERGTESRRDFAMTSAFLGVLTLGLAAYVFSFHEMVGEILHGRWRGWAWIATPILAVLAGLLALAAAWTRRLPEGKRLFPAVAVPASAILLQAGALFPGVEGEVLAVLLCNLSAVLLAAVAIWSGLGEERRSHFWLGSLFLVLLVLSRFLEYDTSLLAKSAAFVACGVAVLVAGIRYEQHLRRKEAPAHA